jgi:hypothetical protein
LKRRLSDRDPDIVGPYSLLPYSSKNLVQTTADASDQQNREQAELIRTTPAHEVSLYRVCTAPEVVSMDPLDTLCARATRLSKLENTNRISPAIQIVET